LKRSETNRIFKNITKTINNNVTTRVLRHRRRKEKPLNQSCLILLVKKRYVDGIHDESLCFCELHGDDIGNDERFKIVRILGLPNGWCDDESSNIKSAQTELLAGSRGMKIDYNSSKLLLTPFFVPKIQIIDTTSQIIITTSQTNNITSDNEEMNTTLKTRVDYDDDDSKNNNLTEKEAAATGNEFSILVLRGNGIDSRMTYAVEELSDSIFGTSGDPINLRSQYSACSYNQVIFKPTTRDGTLNGVYDVTLKRSIIGSWDSDITNAMVNQAERNFGTKLTKFVNYVMICIPPGTRGNWIAYAIQGYWLSVYNDKWCTYPSSQMHELGHNMKLAHSGDGNNPYGDQSGLMGYSYGTDNGPKMCFNGVKTYQLGWFKEYHQDFSSDSGFFIWEGNLMGFVHRDQITKGEKMILRFIDNNSNLHYFVHFNRADSFNTGTKEGRDLVLVASGYNRQGTRYLRSNLLAELSAGQQFMVPRFGGALLRIFVSSINLETNRARVNVNYQNCSDDASYRFRMHSNSLNRRRRKRRRRKRINNPSNLRQNCQWIAQVSRRITTYCSNSKIRESCRSTCQTC